MNILNNIKIFYDGIHIEKFNNLDYIKGYTTNPSILNNDTIKNKFSNYIDFATYFLSKSNGLPVSFEIFADDYDEIINQALQINSWGQNVYVKIPIINTKGEYNDRVITTLNNLHIKLNITAIFTNEGVDIAYNSLHNKNIPTIISLFCGRIADTGVNPKDICDYTYSLCKNDKDIEILWASTREIYNIFNAVECKCDIITIPDDILSKLNYIGKDLHEYSLDTVKKFYDDGLKSNIQF